MITGSVEGDEGRIQLKVIGSKGRQKRIEVIIDTGYTATLSLPPALVAALGLRWQAFDRGVLADGSECLVDVYEAKVVWDGETRRVLVDEAGSDPLIGMALLRGNELKMQVCARGKVTVKRLPAEIEIIDLQFGLALQCS